MATFQTTPHPRDDGGTDHKRPDYDCPNYCYQDDQEGAYVSQCPFLKVSVEGLECLDDDNC